MRTVYGGLLAEENSGFRVGPHGVVAKLVVGILHADRDSVSLVVREVVVFEDAVFDSPAEKQPIAFVVPATNSPDYCMLSAAPRMQAHTDIGFADAIFNCHILRRLEADGIAVVVANRALFDSHVLAFEQKDAASPTARQILHAVGVAVDRQASQLRVVRIP